MEMAAVHVNLLNVRVVETVANFLTPHPRFLEPAGIGLTRVEHLDCARRQMAHLVTDRLTPWLEPYHPPAGR